MKQQLCLLDVISVSFVENSVPITDKKLQKKLVKNGIDTCGGHMKAKYETPGPQKYCQACDLTQSFQISWPTVKAGFLS